MKELKTRIEKFRLKVTNYLQFVPVNINNSNIEISVWGDNNNIIDTPSKYIENLIDQIKDDIFPLMFFTRGHAPYAVLRNLFCYLDHVARLRFGNNKSSLDQIFNKGDFGCYPFIKKRYQHIFKDLIQLYRHELIHQTRPLPKIRNVKVDRNFKTIGVGFHISSDINKKIYDSSVMNFRLMSKFMKDDKNRKHLNHLRSAKKYSAFIVNNFCFLFDVIDYLKRYSDDLSDQKKNFSEIKIFCTHYIDIILENLRKPSGFTLILDKKSASKTDIENGKAEEWYKEMRKKLFKEL